MTNELFTLAVSGEEESWRDGIESDAIEKV